MSCQFMLEIATLYKGGVVMLNTPIAISYDVGYDLEQVIKVLYK